jgi:hypothetical protein
MCKQAFRKSDEGGRVRFPDEWSTRRPWAAVVVGPSAVVKAWDL